jgi:hypothetical protein
MSEKYVIDKQVKMISDDFEDREHRMDPNASSLPGG